LDNWISVDSHASHVYLLKPVYDWTTDDVWTAPNQFGWDYNRAYDVLERAGVTRHDQRVCPPYGEEPLRGLWQYAQCWPQLWEKMLARVPGAATAGRYCQSPLYGFEDVECPAGMTWEQAIRKELAKFPDDIRAKVAQRLQEDIRKHNRRTANAPIREDGDGLSWKYLYTIALRGDLKRRRGADVDKATLAKSVAGARALKETRWEGT
jgi:predicted phosphoadenosine phosphosulfate sulfurtransferase